MRAKRGLDNFETEIVRTIDAHPGCDVWGIASLMGWNAEYVANAGKTRKQFQTAIRFIVGRRIFYRDTGGRFWPRRKEYWPYIDHDLTYRAHTGEVEIKLGRAYIETGNGRITRAAAERLELEAELFLSENGVNV